MLKTDGSLSREKLRDLRSLDSMKIRRKKNLCIVEGERSLDEALRTRSLLYVVISEERAMGGSPAPVQLRRVDVPCYTLGREHFRKISGVKTGTGLLGVARIPAQGDLHKLPGPPDRSALLYLDGIQEPGNVGGLIRTAWALGWTGVMLGKGTADPFSAKGVRSSAGAVFHLPLYGDMGAREVEELLAQGFSLFVADKGGQDYRQVSYPKRLILALGNEGAGSSDWIRRTGQSVGIPLAEGVDSLNVVVAGGIIAAEMVSIIGHGNTETRGHGD